MTDSRRLFLCAAIALTGILTSTAAPVPPPKKRPEPKRLVYEIDLVHLPEGVTFDIEFHLSAPGKNFALATRAETGMTRKALRDHVLAFIKKSGWRVKKSGDTALIVEGAEDDEFRPVSSAIASVSKLSLERQPMVRRLPAK